MKYTNCRRLQITVACLMVHLLLAANSVAQSQLEPDSPYVKVKSFFLDWEAKQLREIKKSRQRLSNDTINTVCRLFRSFYNPFQLFLYDFYAYGTGIYKNNRYFVAEDRISYEIKPSLNFYREVFPKPGKGSQELLEKLEDKWRQDFSKNETQQTISLTAYLGAPLQVSNRTILFMDDQQKTAFSRLLGGWVNGNSRITYSGNKQAMEQRIRNITNDSFVNLYYNGSVNDGPGNPVGIKILKILLDQQLENAILCYSFYNMIGLARFQRQHGCEWKWCGSTLVGAM